MLSKSSALEEAEGRRAKERQQKELRTNKTQTFKLKTLQYTTLQKQNKKQNNDNAFCKLIRNTFSEADLLKCTTKKTKENKQNIILRSNSSFLYPL